MRRVHTAVVLAVVAVALVLSPSLVAQHQPTIAQYLKPGLPRRAGVGAQGRSHRVDRLRGGQAQRLHRRRRRAFTPVRVTSFLKDDGMDMTQLRISDDGSTVAFVRGSAPNGAGLDRESGERSERRRARDLGRAHRRRPASARAAGRRHESRKSRRTARFVLYVKDGQIYRARVGDAGRDDDDRQGREAVHQRVGPQQRAEVVAGRHARSRSRAIAPITASSGCTT